MLEVKSIEKYEKEPLDGANRNKRLRSICLPVEIKMHKLHVFRYFNLNCCMGPCLHSEEKGI